MISVIIPTYKRSENLLNAIDSVLSQKGDFELIVVDDNDSDTEYRKINEERLKKYLKNPNFHYLKHEKNKNGAAARNTGIKIAKGDYITFLDDDDTFCEDRILKIEETIKKSSPDFICTGVILKRNGILEKKIIPNVSGKIKDLQIGLLNQKSFFATGSNIICKKEIVDKINGFDERFIRHQDTEFVIRALEESNSIYCIEDYLVVKNCDSLMNVPLFSKMVHVKEMFLEKFSYLLDSLPESSKNMIIENNYYGLLGNAYAKGIKDNLKECKKYLKSIGIYSYKKDFKIWLKYFVKKMYIVKKIRSWIGK